MKQTKKALILSIVAIAALVALVVGATYAYFSAQGGTATSVDINVGTATTDIFTFESGKDILIEAYQTNFAEGKDSLSSSTTAKAMLTANNSTNSATYNYYIYANIFENSFKYSTKDSSPELILTVIGPDGKEVTSLDGLEYKTVKDNKGTSITGFDVTTKSGLIAIANKKEIVAGTASAAGKTTIEEEWTVKLTFVNYDADQTNNAGASLKAKITIQKDRISAADLCQNGQSLSSCIIALSDYDETIYHHDGTLDNGLNDGSYRYAGSGGSKAYHTCKYDSDEFDLSAWSDFFGNSIINGECPNIYAVYFASGEFADYSLKEGIETTFYSTSSSARWDNENNKCVTESGFEVYDIWGDSFDQDNCTGTVYERRESPGNYVIGITELGTGVETFYSETTNNVNNYVCFGSDADTCPTDNLYRIIGVFGDQVKLIKSTAASSTLLGTDGDYYSSTKYYWNYKNNTSINNGFGSNTWSTSLLNKTNLNTNYITYLNNINTKWADMIATTTWKVGGNTLSNIYSAVPKTAYANEITNPVTTNTTDSATTYSAKIGLMYVSDYGFAASPSAWSTALHSYDRPSIISVNWMYMDLSEWTISRLSNSSRHVFSVRSGQVDNGFALNSIAVRPVFYLTSTATYSDGVGTSNNPYRLG